MNSSGMTIEALYVVDTHALIWYLIHDKKLGAQAASVFAAAQNGETMLVIPSIVLAEMYYANKKNQWFPDFAETLRNLRAKPYFRLMIRTLTISILMRVCRKCTTVSLPVWLGSSMPPYSHMIRSLKQQALRP